MTGGATLKLWTGAGTGGGGTAPGLPQQGAGAGGAHEGRQPALWQQPVPSNPAARASTAQAWRKTMGVSPLFRRGTAVGATRRRTVAQTEGAVGATCPQGKPTASRLRRGYDEGESVQPAPAG